MVTVIKQIWNNSNYAATVENLEKSGQTANIGPIAPGASLLDLYIEVPWCSNSGDFPGKQIRVVVANGAPQQRLFAVWQASYDWKDRVRVSSGDFFIPGDEIGLFSAVGLIENTFIGDRALIINDTSLWLAPVEITNILIDLGSMVTTAGYHQLAELMRPSGPLVPSVPRKSSATAFSMAGRAAAALPGDITTAYQDSGKRYTFELRDNVRIRGRDGVERTANGVPVVTSPGAVPDILVEGVTPLTGFFIYSKRIAQPSWMRELDMLAASAGRLFAKEKNSDRFFIATMDEMFVDMYQGQPFSAPSTYFKLDRVQHPAQQPDGSVGQHGW